VLHSNMSPGGPARVGHTKHAEYGWEIGSWPLGNRRPLWIGDSVSLYDSSCFVDTGDGRYAVQKEPEPAASWVIRSEGSVGELRFGDEVLLESNATGRFL
jgi:hypothetical protein